MRNRRHSKRLSQQAGLPPGTPVHIGPSRSQPPSYSGFVYGPDGLEELPTTEPRVVLERRSRSPVAWLNMTGVDDVDQLQDLGTALGLHPLVIEDIANTEQRPKVEFYDEYFYIVIKMLRPDEEANGVLAEQVSIVVFPDLVVTFQQHAGDVFELIRNRIRNGLGRVRRMGADYLAYALIDAIVDNYYGILEQLESRIEPLEEAILSEPRKSHAGALLSTKREIVYLRRTLWPLRELLVQLQREAHDRIADEIHPFLRDLQDHVIQVIELLEAFEEMTGSILDTYLSAVSNRMDDVMRVLTIIATIFIPLTFIVGVYGMNFEHMPELAWRWSYPVVWIVMITLVVVLVVLFRRKKWL